MRAIMVLQQPRRKKMPRSRGMTPARWLDLMRGLGIAGHPDVFRWLYEAYSEGHRRYHTVAHIAACLLELDAYRALATFPYEVEVALWFHDAVYVPGACDNERRSADLAASFLHTAGLPPPASVRIHNHILATKHDVAPNDSDSALVVDVDLAILGQDALTYARFEAQIREEYERVPDPLFRRERRKVLASFLEREFIYCLPQLRERYEAPARVNLQRAIAELSR